MFVAATKFPEKKFTRIYDNEKKKDNENQPFSLLLHVWQPFFLFEVIA